MSLKYPHIIVQLTNTDGNAFAILGKVRLALRREGIPTSEIKAFMDEAMSGDYDHLLQVVMRTVDVD